MFKTICIPTLIFYASGFIVTATGHALKQEGLVKLGTSVNVTYYAGRQEISWEAGKHFCEFHNLTLAEVHSQEQEEFLKQALINLDSFSHYWTGGRTRVGLDSLIWDNSLSTLYVIDDVYLTTPEQLCLLIRIPDYETLWEVDPCSDQWPPICQSA